MGYCKKCGAELVEGASFCEVCGTRISKPSTDDVQASADARSTDTVQKAPESNEQPKEKVKTVYIYKDYPDTKANPRDIISALDEWDSDVPSDPPSAWILCLKVAVWIFLVLGFIGSLVLVRQLDYFVSNGAQTMIAILGIVVTFLISARAMVAIEAAEDIRTIKNFCKSKMKKKYR